MEAKPYHHAFFSNMTSVLYVVGIE